MRRDKSQIRGDEFGLTGLENEGLFTRDLKRTR